MHCVPLPGSWLSFPFVDGKNSYAELRWKKDSAGDPQIERFVNRGYVEADGQPVVPARHAGMLYAPLYPSELPEIRGQRDYEWPRAMRLDPSTEGARMCTTCHHIGNANYVTRYPRSVFYFSAPFDSKDPNQQRSDLYLANVTDSLRGSHNTRMLTPSWMEAAVAQVPGFASSERIDPDTIRKHHPAIEAAIEKLTACANSRSPQCWTEHWTLARIEADPLRYLRETCSNCHAADAKTLVHLTTKQELMKGGNAWSRLNNPERPHPPGGRLEASILDILGRYLTR